MACAISAYLLRSTFRCKISSITEHEPFPQLGVRGLTALSIHKPLALERDLSKRTS